MISLRRFYISSASNGNASSRSGGKAPVITSPWIRARSHSTPISNGANSSTNHHNHHHHSSRQRLIERIAIVTVVCIAWAWIMVFVGMIFYHGYRTARGASNVDVGIGLGQLQVAGGGSNAGNLLEVHGVAKALRDESDKHQASRSEGHDEGSEADARIEQLRETEHPKGLEPNESPLLIFTCQRANYLRDTLTDVLKYIPSDCTMGCPVIISQDGNDVDVANVIAEFRKSFLEQKRIPLIHIQHKSALRRGSKATNSYQALAIHYGWALSHVFDGTAPSLAIPSPEKEASKTLPQRLIILEEDLHVAPDFFDYFIAMAPILDNDVTLLAVSAFNDNGFKDTVSDPSRVLRSDFFPGLGWMMTRRLWTSELQAKWPQGWWDDWLREPTQRLGRHVLRPEVSRTFHFGVSGGASQNLFGNQLSKVWLNDKKTDWKRSSNGVADVDHWSSYLKSKETFDRYYWSSIQDSEVASSVQEATEKARERNVRLEYDSHANFQTIVRQLIPPLMDDEKAGIPRTAYKGVVETRPHGTHFLFITPPMADLKREFATAITALASSGALTVNPDKSSSK